MLRLALGTSREQVTRAQLPEPAVQALQVLLLLVEFRSRELLDANLLVDLAFELRPLGQELRPLRLALLVEERFEARTHPIPPRDGVEHQHLTVGPLDELHRPVESVEELRPSRQRPRRLLHRYRAHTAKFPPDRHPVPRRLRGKAIRQQQPIHTMIVACVTLV